MDKRSNRGRKDYHPRQQSASEPISEAEANKYRHPRGNSNIGLKKSLGRKDDTKDAFKPLALNPIGSAEKNDPLLLDAILVEGLTSSVPCQKQREFNNDYSQYSQIVISSYRVMVAQDRAMTKYVSLSMYSYYCNVLLWKRLQHVLTERGDDVTSYEEFIAKLPPLAIPSEVGIYLQGIGNLSDYNQRHYYLALQAILRNNEIEGISGHYGRVDEATHIHYETLPSPFVAVYRLLQDYEYTLRTQRDADPVQDWDLPADLRPATPGLLPNRNLLGWDRSRRLTHEQMMTLESAQLFVTLEEEEDDVWQAEYHTDGIQNYHGFPIVYQLIVSVSEMLSSAKSNQAPFNNYAFPTSCKGSLSQIGFQVRTEGHRGQGFPLVPIYEKESATYSYSDGTVHTFSAASICRYRIQRILHGYNDSLCYTGPAGGAPVGWPATADDVYNSIPNWNHRDFRSVTISGRVVDDKFSEKVRKIAPSDAL